MKKWITKARNPTSAKAKGTIQSIAFSVSQKIFSSKRFSLIAFSIITFLKIIVNIKYLEECKAPYLHKHQAHLQGRCHYNSPPGNRSWS